MDASEKSSPRKNTKISFRTDDLTLSKLKAVCRIESKTISALIEDVLTEYVLCQENPMISPDEKRLCPRKQCSLSAVMFSRHNGSLFYHNSTIVNMSSTSLQVLLKTPNQHHDFDSAFDILFSLPNHEHPLLLTCRVVRTGHLHEETMIVAKFQCRDSLEDAIVRQFLTNSNLTAEYSNKKKQS